MRSTIAAIGLFGAVIAFGISPEADASLIGDSVTFQCTNCGPPTNDSFTVIDGAIELTLFDQLQIDVEEDTLQINWIFASQSIIDDINFRWTSLDAGSPILAASIDPLSTWGVAPAVQLAFTANSVSLTNTGDVTVVPGDFIRIHLAVPEPVTGVLLALGLLGFAGWRRARG